MIHPMYHFCFFNIYAASIFMVKTVQCIIAQLSPWEWNLRWIEPLLKTFYDNKNKYFVRTSNKDDWSGIYVYPTIHWYFMCWPYNFATTIADVLIIPPPNEVGGGVYWIHLVRLSVCPSVRLSVDDMVFRSISQVCFGISISNFICMLMVAIGRSLLIFSDVTFKMAAWRPYWIFWFPDSNFTLALNINFKLQRHNTYVYG